MQISQLITKLILRRARFRNCGSAPAVLTEPRLSYDASDRFWLIGTDLDRFGPIWTDLDWFGLIWTDLARFGLILKDFCWLWRKCSKLSNSDRSRWELSNGGSKTFVRWKFSLLMTFQSDAITKLIMFDGKLVIAITKLFQGIMFSTQYFSKL